MKTGVAIFGLLAVASAAGIGWVQQHQKADELRDMLEQQRETARELARLREEHARLTATRIDERELEALRADRAAVVRLRGEIEKLKQQSAATSPVIPASNP